MKSRILVVALLTLALGACTDENKGAEGASASGPAAVSSDTAGPTGSAGPGPSAGPQTDPSSKANPGGDVPVTDTLVAFTRTGGLAGNNDKLVVRPDGSYVITTRQGTRNGKLTADELAALKTALASVDFNKMPTANDGGAMADGYTYTVTYNGRQIEAKDGGIPPALQPVISALGAFLSK